MRNVVLQINSSANKISSVPSSGASIDAAHLVAQRPSEKGFHWALGIVTKTVVESAKSLLYQEIPDGREKRSEYRLRERYRDLRRSRTLLPGERVGICCRHLVTMADGVHLEAGGGGQLIIEDWCRVEASGHVLCVHRGNHRYARKSSNVGSKRIKVQFGCLPSPCVTTPANRFKIPWTHLRRQRRLLNNREPGGIFPGMDIFRRQK